MKASSRFVWETGQFTVTAPRPKKARVLGGPGSGNFGHSGRPGMQGGSGESAEDLAEFKGKEGLCFANVNKWNALHGEKDDIVVHGKVTNIDGKTFDHAWVERDEKVIDPTTAVVMAKDKYYDLLKAKPEGKYTSTQAIQNQIRARNHGPWTADEVGTRHLGGPGSGNFGHAGIPGQQGGSAPGEGNFPPAKEFGPLQRGVPQDEGYGRTENSWAINSKLIAGKELDAREQEMVDDVERLQMKSKTEENMTVFHKGTIPSEGSITTPAFLSTSTTPPGSSEFRGKIIAVQVPKGTHFAYGSFHEKERILPRDGTLTRVGKMEDGTPIMRYKESSAVRDRLDEREAKWQRQFEEEMSRYAAAKKKTYTVHTVADTFVPALRKAILSSLKPSSIQDEQAALAFVESWEARLREALIPVLRRIVVTSGTLHGLKIRTAGGPGSGNFGHAGIPGQQGGSAPSDASDSPKADSAHSIAPTERIDFSKDRLFLYDPQSNRFVLGKAASEDLIDSIIDSFDASHAGVLVDAGLPATGRAYDAYSVHGFVRDGGIKVTVLTHAGDSVKMNDDLHALFTKLQVHGATAKTTIDIGWGGRPLGDYLKQFELYRGLSALELSALEFRAAKKPSETSTAKTKVGKFGLKFDVANPRAIAWARTHAAKLAVDMSEETRRAVRAIIARGFTQGRHPYQTAKLLLDVIGLTERQGVALMSYRDKLEEQGFLGKDLDDEVLVRSNEMFEARAEMIARTETMRASNEGQQELWNQAVDAGLLTGAELREWIVTPDDRLCPICEAMEGQTVGMGEPFDVDGEDVMVPPAHPNCRCTIGISAESPGPANLEAYRELGGPGSGNFGHAGIPGQQGGSAPGDGEGKSYRETKGTDPAVNESIVKAAGLKIKCDEKDKADLYEALAHVLDEKQLVSVLKDKTVEVKDLGNRHGLMAASLYVDRQSLKSEGPGFAAAIIYHELQHAVLTKQGVSSSQQESRVRFSTKIWAGLKSGSMWNSNPRAARGFKKAMEAS